MLPTPAQDVKQNLEPFQYQRGFFGMFATFSKLVVINLILAIEAKAVILFFKIPFFEGDVEKYSKG